MSTEYYTVVYRVEGGKEKHDEWWRAIQPMFLADGLPISVIVVAKFDALAKLDELEERS